MTGSLILLPCLDSGSDYSSAVPIAGTIAICMADHRRGIRTRRICWAHLRIPVGIHRSFSHSNGMISTCFSMVATCQAVAEPQVAVSCSEPVPRPCDVHPMGNYEESTIIGGFLSPIVNHYNIPLYL